MKNNFFGKIAIIGDGITAKLAAIMFKNLKIEPVLIANKRKNKSVSHATISISNNTANILEQNGIQVIKKANPVHAIKLYEYKYSGREDVIFYNKTEKQPLSYIILKSDLDKILDLSLNKEIKILKTKPHDSSLTLNTISSPNKKLKWNYHEKAFTFLISHSKILNFCARQIFLEEGPIAFLPLNSNTTSVVFSINEKSELIQTLGDKNVLEKYLSKNFEFIKNIKVFSDVESYDLKFQFLNSTFKNNEIYVGDIAHRIHPIAGQGWNMTVRDINNLTKIYKSKIKYGYKLNDYSILKEFDKKSKLNNFVFASSIDLIRRSFKFKNKNLSKGRKKILNELDTLPELKREIIKVADKGLNF